MHVKPPSTGPDNSKESPSGWILRFDEVLSFKASTCLAPGDCGALIPVPAQFFCGPGQVTSSSEEGIHQVPHGPAEMAKGCKTILSSNGRRGRLEALSAVLSQLPATAPEVLVLRHSWGGLLWESRKPVTLFEGLYSHSLGPSSSSRALGQSTVVFLVLLVLFCSCVTPVTVRLYRWSEQGLQIHCQVHSTFH